MWKVTTWGYVALFSWLQCHLWLGPVGLRTWWMEKNRLVQTQEYTHRMQTQNQALLQKIHWLFHANAEFIESRARRDLSLVKPGEEFLDEIG